MKLCVTIETDEQTLRIEVPSAKSDHDVRDLAEGLLPQLMRLACQRFRWQIYGDSFGAQTADYTITQLVKELDALGVVVERVT